MTFIIVHFYFCVRKQAILDNCMFLDSVKNDVRDGLLRVLSWPAFLSCCLCRFTAAALPSPITPPPLAIHPRQPPRPGSGAFDRVWGRGRDGAGDARAEQARARDHGTLRWRRGEARTTIRYAPPILTLVIACLRTEKNKKRQNVA